MPSHTKRVTKPRTVHHVRGVHVKKEWLSGVVTLESSIRIWLRSPEKKKETEHFQMPRYTQGQFDVVVSSAWSFLVRRIQLSLSSHGTKFSVKMHDDIDKSEGAHWEPETSALSLDQSRILKGFLHCCKWINFSNRIRKHGVCYCHQWEYRIRRPNDNKSSFLLSS